MLNSFLVKAKGMLGRWSRDDYDITVLDGVRNPMGFIDLTRGRSYKYKILCDPNTVLTETIYPQYESNLDKEVTFFYIQSNQHNPTRLMRVRNNRTYLTRLLVAESPFTFSIEKTSLSKYVGWKIKVSLAK